MIKTKTLQWQGCYDAGWQNKITGESFAHPAKFANGLIHRIYQYAIRQGYLKPGDTVLDPFGGAGLGAIATQYGLNWVGVELEQFFVDLGAGCDCTGISQADWVRFYGRWKQAAYKDGRHWCPQCLAEAGEILPEPSPQLRLFGEAEGGAGYVRNSGQIPETKPHRYRGNLELFERYAKSGAWAVLLKGDSRRLLEVLGAAGLGGAVGSPPYERQMPSHDNFIPPHDSTQLLATDYSTAYGQSPGQLGAMPPGQFDASVASPPFAGNTGGQGEASRNGIDPALFDRHQGGMKRGTGADKANLDHLPTKGFEAAIGSPPYANSKIAKNSDGVDLQKNYETYQASGGGQSFEDYCRTQARHSNEYGSSDGQMGQMPTTDFQAAIGSPPFANSAGSDDPQKRGGLLRDDPKRAGDRNLTGSYGESEGQLGAMVEGGFGGSVGSPPYAESINDGLSESDRAKYGELSRMGRGVGTDYGGTNGQLGAESGLTFWAAARQIIEQVYLALAPGAYAIWVCKNFVRDGQIVPFCDQWRQLCEACGFEHVETIRAMLVKSHGAQVGLGGEVVELETARKSFFRRLAEKNGSPRIDWEEVIILRKDRR